MKLKLHFLLAAAIALPLANVLSGDWPQWRGPNRDDASTEAGLLKTWPADGPKLVWMNKDAGLGYSG